MNKKKLKTYPISERKNLVNVSQFAESPDNSRSVLQFIVSLPDILAGADFKNLLEAIISAHKNDLPVIAMLGGHVIKSGVSPAIIALMEHNVISSVAMNGAASIHDFEIAMIGKTSEDVETNIQNGSFGMWHETGHYMNKAIKDASYGIGDALASMVCDFAHKEHSILYHVERLNIPITVHISIGTDIIHQHPEADGAAIGRAAMQDFYDFVDTISAIRPGAVVLNFGSAVIMPEVFLKAVAMARNLGHNVSGFIAANFDMIQHYRPKQNILTRGNIGGKGYAITGHHEIMIPLLAHGVLDMLR